MKQVVKELRAYAKQHGFKVKVYVYGPLKGDSHIRNFSPQSPSGEFDRSNKQIIIRKYRNTFYKFFMLTLAHEIGHLVHLVEGKYPRYYSDYWSKAVANHFNGTMPEKLDVSCFLQGIRAERDADRWADEFLANRGFFYKKREPYPALSVMGYWLYRDFMGRKKK